MRYLLFIKIVILICFGKFLYSSELLSEQNVMSNQKQVSQVNMDNMDNIDIEQQNSEFLEKIQSDDVSRFAKFRLLNKVTSINSELVLEVNKPKEFDYGIEANLITCVNGENVVTKNNDKTLVEVYDTSNQQRKKIFFGWLFSLYDSLNFIEHSVYDINLISCVN